jgi:hypothetical protein
VLRPPLAAWRGLDCPNANSRALPGIGAALIVEILAQNQLQGEHGGFPQPASALPTKRLGSHDPRVCVDWGRLLRAALASTVGKRGEVQAESIAATMKAYFTASPQTQTKGAAVFGLHFRWRGRAGIAFRDSLECACALGLTRGGTAT